MCMCLYVMIITKGKEVINLRIEWKGHGRGLVRGGMRVVGEKGKREMA